MEVENTITEQPIGASHEWVRHTPGDADTEYLPVHCLLVMHDADGMPLQQVEISRDEFIELKEHLGKVRGLLPEKLQLGGEPITEDEHDFLGKCLQIERDCTGSTSPVEEFITALVELHTTHGLMPEDIRYRLEEMEESFNPAITVAAHIVRKYPDLVRAQLPKGSILQTAAEVEMEAAKQRRAEAQAAEKERVQAEIREDSARRNAEQKAAVRAFRKKYPSEAKRIDDFITWTSSLDDDQQGMVMSRVCTEPIMASIKRLKSTLQRGERIDAPAITPKASQSQNGNASKNGSPRDPIGPSTYQNGSPGIDGLGVN